MAYFPVIQLIVLILSLSYCGMVNGQSGWVDAEWWQYPFMVQVRTTIDGNTYGCGGSILTLDGHNGKGAILTAAHCVGGITTVYVGCTTSACWSWMDSKTIYSSESITIHQSYAGVYHDIAIVYLTQAITDNGAIAVVLESDPLLAKNNDEVKLTGYWGLFLISDTLEYAISHIMTRSECDDTYGGKVTTANDFCVGGRNDISTDGTATICYGDSGSPVMYDGKQIGINSFIRTGYCNPGKPQAATYIPSYYSWILKECGINCLNRAEYVGCYGDTSSRAFRYGPGAYGYNIDSCQAACDGYKYFALQDVGQCWCENDYKHATKYGVTTTCPETRDGGRWQNDVFVHPGYKYKGCYKDTTDRALRFGPQQYGYNPTSCRVACREYQFFSLQDNGQCFCENDWNSVIKYGESTACPLNRLGASWAFDVFENFAYYRCFKDTSDRALRYGPKQYGYNVHSCRAACINYQYFSLQDHGQCFCENDYNHATKYGELSSACPDGLGGPWANALYHTSNSELVADAPVFNILGFSLKVDSNTVLAVFGIVSILIIILFYVNFKLIMLIIKLEEIKENNTMSMKWKINI